MSFGRGLGALGPLLFVSLAFATTVTVPLTRTVANIEYARSGLLKAPTPPGTRAPQIDGEAWFGAIVRRLPDDLAAHGIHHFVPFMAEYSAGQPVRAWWDQNLDGDLTDDPQVTLDGYPPIAGARSFLARLRGEGNRTIRVVLEPKAAGSDIQPVCRQQSVFAMTGTATLGGEAFSLFAFDGDGDGRYSRSLEDGVFLDADRDRHYQVDEMGPEFGSFVVPVSAAGREWIVTALDPEGKSVTLRDTGPAVARSAAPATGSAAPDFSFVATDGRDIRLASFRGRPVLVYFWSSGCATCRDQADRLGALYTRFHPRGLEILGVSYDTDRAAAEQFRAAHGQTWPTSISGHAVWEDPVGRLYRERGSGVLYLVDASGTLRLVSSNLEALETEVASLFPATSDRSSP